MRAKDIECSEWGAAACVVHGSIEQVILKIYENGYVFRVLWMWLFLIEKMDRVEERHMEEKGGKKKCKWNIIRL